VHSPAPTPQASPDPTQVHIPSFMPFFWLACAGICGALGASWLKFPWQWWAVLLGLSGLGVLWQAIRASRLQPRKEMPLSAAAFAFCLIALLYQLSLPANTAEYIGYYVGKGEVEAQGVVSEPPEDWEGGQELVVRVQSVKPLSADVATADQGSARGKILLRTSPGSAYAYGDLLAIRGELTQAGESAAF